MTAKNRDKHNRWRNITVSFRVSDEENAIINRLVALSGLSKQEYITTRLTQKDVIVYGNPKVYKALKTEMLRIYDELSRLSDANEISYELQEVIKAVSFIYEGMATTGGAK
ncbi:plasmid mobilization protein [Anaerotignum sp.]